MLKYGSDMADENAAEEWEANQAKGATAFLDYIDSLKGNNSE